MLAFPPKCVGTLIPVFTVIGNGHAGGGGVSGDEGGSLTIWD